MRRTQLDGLLDSAFRIRPGEAPRVGLMFLYVMGVVSTFIINRTVRDTLFLSRYRIERLPWMYIAVAFGVSLVSYAYSRVADRHRRDKVIIRSLLIFATAFAAFWLLLHLRLAGTWLYPALYITVEIVGAITVIQFWTFANDIYNAREAKRLFGVIGAGGVLSNITCGFAIGAAVPIFGSENLLLVCALLLIGCIALVRRIARLSETELELAAKAPKRARIGIARDSGAVLHSRHLQIIAAIVTITFLTVTLIDYQFKIIAKETYKEAELAEYFGYFYGFTGIISSVLQFFVTSRILERFGIVGALLVLPLGLLCGAGSMLLVPVMSALVAVTIAKGAENIFRYTVNDATTQLLYVPVPAHARARAKAFIDGILKPVSIGIAGLAILGLSRILDKDRFALHLAYLDVVLIAGWLLLVLAVRREYVKSLIDTLEGRRFDATHPWNPEAEDTTLRVLKKTLRSKRESEVLHALELLASIDADFDAELRPLLQHPSAAVRVGALKLVRLKSLAEPLLSDRSDEVRAAAIGALSMIGGDLERLHAPLLDLMTASDPRVRRAAIDAAGPMHSLELLPSLIEQLKSRETSEAAVRALARYGARAEEPMLQALEDESRDLGTRKLAAKVLGLIGGGASFDRLLVRLGLVKTELGIAIARALSKIKERDPRARIDNALLESALKSQIEGAYQSLAIIEDLGLPPNDLLSEALFHRQRLDLELAFRLLEIRYPARTIQLIYSNFDSATKAVRANALEVADNVLQKDESRVLLPLIEDLPLAEKIRQGAGFFTLIRNPPDRWLASLLAGPDAWTVTCALWLIGKEQRISHRDAVLQHSTSPDPIVNETAGLVLARLMEAPDQGVALNEASMELAGRTGLP